MEHDGTVELLTIADLKNPSITHGLITFNMV